MWSRGAAGKAHQEQNAIVVYHLYPGMVAKFGFSHPKSLLAKLSHVYLHIALVPVSGLHPPKNHVQNGGRKTVRNLKKTGHFLLEKSVLSPVRLLSLLLLWLLGSLSPVMAQEPVGTGIARFGLVQLGEGVRVEVTLQAGFTCNGIQLLRSNDSLQFETVGLIGGVCGSTTEEVSYDFFDPLPLNGQRYFYSLLLGGRIPSEVLSIRLLDFNKIGFVMGPNPAREQVFLRWQNELEQLYVVELLGPAGQPIESWESRENELLLQLHGQSDGMYFIRLRNKDAGGAWVQRLIVQ